MRAIDADALIEQMEADAEHLDNAISKMMYYAAISDVKHASTIEERKTGRWIETEGLDEEIRCTMCTNPMRSDRGCDGSCQYDEKLYKQIMSIIKDRIVGGGA